MVRAMCVEKLLDKKMAKDLLLMMDFEEIIDLAKLAKAYGVRLCDHLRRHHMNNILKKALGLREKVTWKRDRQENLGTNSGRTK